LSLCCIALPRAQAQTLDRWSATGVFTNPTPWLDNAARSNRAPAAADFSATTNSNGPAAARERFFELATRRRFPRIDFQPWERLRPSTLGLNVEQGQGGLQVTTPVGLGLSPSEARSWIAPFSETVLTNFDAFERAYRSALAPAELGGPGLTFAEAQTAAFQSVLAYSTLSPGRKALQQAASAENADTAVGFTFEQPGGGGAWPAFDPCWSGLPWYGFYEYPSTARPPASFSEQIPRQRIEFPAPRCWTFSPGTTPHCSVPPLRLR